ncbi:MAG: VWA domain-containing protein [Terriglobia bacterium]|nr:VWA domain-containing protein [Terriglobia bacterium]
MKHSVSLSISRALEAVLGMTAGVTIFGRELRCPDLRAGRIWSAAFPLAARLLAIVTVLLMPAVACTQQTDGTLPDVRYTINVNVEEVVLHATVRNRKGTPVAGLCKRNFQLFEDRVPQSIKHFSHEDIPVTVGIVIDNSGSMRPKRAEVIAAALAFAASSNPQDQMFLVNFNERVSFGLPSNILFTDQPDQLKAAMGTVIADGRTALYDAVAVALEHLKKGNRDKKVLIVVSDGADNASRLTKKQMLAMATQSNAIIYALGIYEPDDPENRDPQVLSALTKASGGEAYFPKSLHDVQPICELIAHEIRNQYTISYIPTNQKADGTYRTIQLRAASDEGRGLAVTTRAGYVAPLKPATEVKP